MVTDPRRPAGDRRWFDDDQVDPERQVREAGPIGEAAPVEEAQDGTPDVPSLPRIERVFGQAERSIPPPADLDDHEGGARPRLDRHDVELAMSDPHLTPQDPPGGAFQP